MSSKQYAKLYCLNCEFETLHEVKYSRQRIIQVKCLHCGKKSGIDSEKTTHFKWIHPKQDKDR